MKLKLCVPLAGERVGPRVFARYSDPLLHVRDGMEAMWRAANLCIQNGRNLDTDPLTQHDIDAVLSMPIAVQSPVIVPISVVPSTTVEHKRRVMSIVARSWDLYNTAVKAVPDVPILGFEPKVGSGTIVPEQHSIVIPPVTNVVISAHPSMPFSNWKWKAVMFPTLLTRGLESEDIIGFELYIVSNRTPNGYVYHSRTRSIDGYYLYGVDLPHIPFDLHGDWYVYCIDPNSASSGHIVPTSGHKVTGTSCLASLYLAVHGSFGGLYPTALTGSVNHSGTVFDTGTYQVKRAALQPYGIGLLGNSLGCFPRLRHMHQLV